MTLVPDDARCGLRMHWRAERFAGLLTVRTFGYALVAAPPSRAPRMQDGEQEGSEEINTEGGR